MAEKTDLIIAIAAITIVMGLLTVFIIYFIIVYRKKQRTLETERELFKRTLLQTEVEIKEQTLTDISRDLHDNLGPLASLIKINLNLILSDLPKEYSGKVAESLDLMKQLISDIRSLSVSLKGENLERFGLVKMLEKDLERYRRIGGLTIDFSLPATLPDFEKSTAVFLYRMTQEIFNNILKHAKATTVTVKMNCDKGCFELMIRDNGIGFEMQREKQGSGLINLKQRCEMINAEFDLQSKPNHGTIIHIKKQITA